MKNLIKIKKNKKVVFSFRVEGGCQVGGLEKGVFEKKLLLKTRLS